MTINDVTDQMYAYCSQHYYWEAIESIFIKYLGCEIQDVEYNDQLQVYLRLTDENIAVFIQYFKDTPNEYHPWMILMEIKTPDGVSTIKVNILEWSQSGCGNFSTKYEKVVEEILNLLKPICIGSN